MVKAKLILLSTLFLMFLNAKAQKVEEFVNTKDDQFLLTEKGAEYFAEMALSCIHREYPNKTSHTTHKKGDTGEPSEMHPAFYGCYDWHSAVHGHWMLVKILKNYPQIKLNKKIRKAISKNITVSNIIKETKYFEGHKWYERTYGWAWLLKLSEELDSWEDEDGKKWARALLPLEMHLVKKYKEYLPNLTYPIRTGVHPNTAFALAFALDYARKKNFKDFEQLLVKKTTEFYFNDKNAPIEWEPNGSDFFSPSLMEAALMSRCMETKVFEGWIKKFINLKKAESILKPATVSNRNDYQIVHLDGLNLSRAWCMFEIIKKLSEKNKYRKEFIKAARVHLTTTLPNITSEEYGGGHWLASFTIYAFSVIK